jgi:ferritin-like metal-binding protein YciE
MNTPKELFVHELADMVSAEGIVLKLLPELAREAQHPEVKTAFTAHAAETKEQVARLKQIFELLGEKPEKTVCHATEGLKKEHEALHEEQPSAQILELGNLMGAAKTEHYEIASYQGLVQMAMDLGEREVAALLQQTLTEEQAMATRLAGFAKTLGKAANAGVAV